MAFHIKQDFADLEDTSSTIATTTEGVIIYNLSYAPEVRELIHYHWLVCVWTSTLTLEGEIAQVQD